MGQSVEVKLQTGITGFFRAEAFRAYNVFRCLPDGEYERIGELELIGTRRKLGDWKRNQILDTGRNVMSEKDGSPHNNWAGSGSKCQVGTGTTSPTPANTQLETYLAGTDNIYGSPVTGARATEPYYGYNRTTYRFLEGEAEGNISEVGVGWDTINGPYLISRGLLTEQDGTQKTYVVLGNEYLDVFYELRYYPPLADADGTVTLDGTVYNTKTRASSVTSWGQYIGQALGVRAGNTNWVAYDGEIGPITGQPSGSSALCDNSNQSNLGYVNNSYEIDMNCNCGISGWNIGSPPASGGIRCIRITTNAGWFQTRFGSVVGDNPIPKTTNFQMNLVWTLDWYARAILEAAPGVYAVSGQDVSFSVA